MRRSRRNGQLRRTSSICFGSHSTTRISSLIVRRFGEHAAERIADERRAPEFEPAFRRPFEADAIHRRDIDAVGDGVRALHGPPGIVLRRAVLRLFGGMPADGGRIEKNVRARERGEARRFGIPLVPADQRRDAAELRIERAEAEIARREVKLLEEERIVRDVHLAVDARAASPSASMMAAVL